MGRKLGDPVSLSLVGLVMQRTNPEGRRAGQRGRLVPIERWVLVLGTLTIGSGILLGLLRVFVWGRLG